MSALRWPARSLWQRLLTPLLSVWVASALIAAISAYSLAGRATDISFDRILADDAVALGTQLQWTGGRALFVASKATADSLVFNSLSGSRYVVRTLSGRTLIGDLTIDSFSAISSIPGKPTFFDISRSSGAMRAVALPFSPRASDELVWVVVAESKAARESVSREIAIAIFLPAVLVGFVFVPLVSFGIRRALASTKRIVAEAERYGTDDLSPLPTDNVPEELTGLVRHTNEMIFRLKASIGEQRRLIADAAHQLQTPIAGIRLLVEDLKRTRRADPSQPANGEVLLQLDEVASRAARLVRQLLSFARAENEASAEDEVFDCFAITAETTSRWSSAVATAGKHLHLHAFLSRSTGADKPSATLVRGSPTMFGEAVSNLIDNSLRYGGMRTEIRVRAEGDLICIQIHDDGPSLDADTLAKMVLPFWRGSLGHSEGSGLGLSIAQRVVARMGGWLLVKGDGAVRGTQIELWLVRVPLPDGPA